MGLNASYIGAQTILQKKIHPNQFESIPSDISNPKCALLSLLRAAVLNFR